MKVAEISGILFASCSNAPKCGKKCNEFKFLYRKHSQTAVLWTYQSPSKKNNTTSNSTSHGQEVSDLAKVPVLAVHLSESVNPFAQNFRTWKQSIPPRRAQNYSKIRLLTLRVKFDGISARTPELKHLPWTAFIHCIWNILFPITIPFAKKCSFSDLCIFCLLSSTKSVPMHLVTCWKYKQSHIFISSCRNDLSQLQNCRTKRFFTVFGTLCVTWRQHKEILSLPPPPKQSMFCLFLQVRTFLFGLMREVPHHFNGCAKTWSAPGILLLHNFIIVQLARIRSCERF